MEARFLICYDEFEKNENKNGKTYEAWEMFSFSYPFSFVPIYVLDMVRLNFVNDKSTCLLDDWIARKLKTNI